MDLSATIKNLPTLPGVYQYFDKNGKILYVGKAKNLKNRVSSYFLDSKADSFKTRVLVKQIARIEHTVVETEIDALLLENNLIKEFQPKYNVLLKDDKTFPWICIKNERFPRIFSTRKLVKDGSLYFGPYTSAVMVRTLLEFVRKLYPIRTCKHNLSKENIKAGKFKRCLEYHLGNCLAPCEGLYESKAYGENIELVKKILKGNISDVIKYMTELMNSYSTNYQYEEAQKIKEKIEHLERFKSKSTIVNPKINDVDIFSITEYENSAFVNYLKLVKGAIVQSHTIEMVKKLEETKEELLELAIIDLRSKVSSNSKEIILPFKIEEIAGIKYTVPLRGDKQHLLQLSLKNANNYKKRAIEEKEKIRKAKSTDNWLEVVQKDLRLKSLPIHIECFDNSNIQGSNPVAACVVFKNGKPAKKEYRHFNIKTVVGPDDFASMTEVVGRRYSRLVNEQKELPQLIVIDGGKGQLNAAVIALRELNLLDKIGIIGIAKKLEEIYYPGDSIPLYINKNSRTLKLIQHLRNEAHRFGITFHRLKRSNDMIETQLSKIEGIGKKTEEKLLKAFGSVEGIKSKSKEEIAKVIGDKLATKLLKAL